MMNNEQLVKCRARRPRRAVILAPAAVVLAVLLLTSCNWREPVTDEPTPTPVPAEDASPTSIPWAITRKNPHSGMFGIAWNPTDLRHPLLTTDRIMREMYTLMYDSLFILDQEYNAHEQLCRSMRSTDNQTFIITLRQNIIFNNGQPLTAADVYSSIQTARSPESPYSARLACIESVRIEGEDIEIVLYSPNPRFAALLTFPIVCASENAFPWAGTGSYEYTSDGDRNYLTPFANSWKKIELPLGHIELVAVDKLEDITYLMGTGDISIVTTDINDNYDVSFGGDYDVWDYPTSAMYYVGFNKSHPLLGNNLVRLALSSLFDRSTLVTQVFKNAADAAVLPVSPAIADLGDGYDLKFFAGAMSELGIEDVDNDGILNYQQGRNYQSFTLRFITNEEDIQAKVTAEYLAEELIKSGIEVELLPLSASEYNKALNAGDYELYCDSIVLSADFSIQRWLTSRTATGSSIATNSSIATGSSITDGYEAFLTEMPIAPLLFKREYVLTHWSEVSGILPVYGNPYVNVSDWTVKQ